MALKNITNINFKKLTSSTGLKSSNKMNSNKNNENIMRRKDDLILETLECSPSANKYNNQYHHQYYHRTSSPITTSSSPYKLKVQQPVEQPKLVNKNLFKYNSAAITSLPTLKHRRNHHKSKSSTRSTSEMRSKSNGMLKLALYNNCGLLTVHVIQSRNLRIQNNERYDTYARVTMLPDPEQRLKCQTAIIKDTLNPIFDEKFSL